MNKKGFTLIELLIVMSVVAILVSIIIPSFRALQEEAWLNKVEKEVKVLKLAVEAYKMHRGAYPADIVITIQNTKPTIVTGILKDPWKTSGPPYDTYKYITGKTEGGEDYFLVYSKALSATDNYTIIGDKILISKGMVLETNLSIIPE